MVDEHKDYRPAGSRDFARAVRDVDAEDLRASSPSPRETMSNEYGERAHAEWRGRDARKDELRGDERARGPTPATGALGADRDRDARVGTADVGAMGARAAVTDDDRIVDRDRRFVDRPEATTVTERRVDDPAGPRPFSIAAGFFGWAVASFFTLVLATIVLALLGAAAYDATDAGTTGVTQDAFNDLTTGGLVGLLVALFVAYVLGGYAAGRIGLWHGVGHGVAVVAWTVLFTILTIALGAWLGDAVAGLNLVPAIDWNDLTGPAIAGLLVSLLTMLGGAILGAKLGTRPYGIDGAYEGRRSRAWRGRPL